MKMKAKKLGIIGKKLGMTQMYVNGVLVGVTVVDFSDMQVVGSRTKVAVDGLKRKDGQPRQADGYDAVILGYDFRGEEAKFVKEFRVPDTSIYTDNKYLETLGAVKSVDVWGEMKGRGFAGVMKRHGFHGGPASHGAKHWHRRPGSVGGHTYPAKTWKGKKMAGHYGNSTVCILSQDLVKVDAEKRLLFIRGSIPGSKNSYVMVRDSIKG